MCLVLSEAVQSRLATRCKRAAAPRASLSYWVSGGGMRRESSPHARLDMDPVDWPVAGDHEQEPSGQSMPRVDRRACASCTQVTQPVRVSKLAVVQSLFTG